MEIREPSCKEIREEEAMTKEDLFIYQVLVEDKYLITRLI